jgi:hypothetical protein
VYALYNTTHTDTQVYQYLPEGFVLKKYMVARVMLRNIKSWRFMDARIQTLTKAKDRTSVITMVPTVTAA